VDGRPTLRTVTQDHSVTTDIYRHQQYMSTIKDKAQSTEKVSAINQSHGLVGNVSSREQKFQGANWPGSEKAR